jgi:hypothetical protein
MKLVARFGLPLAMVFALGVPAAASAGMATGVNAGPYLDSATAKAIKAASISRVRAPIFWRDVQPAGPQSWEWAGTDDQVRHAAISGLALDVALAGSPEWAISSIAAKDRGSVDTLPANAADFAAFARAMVARYGTSGSYWAANPAVPKRPIIRWQIWNEPNLTYFAGAAANSPMAYERVFTAAATAIKAVDRNSRIRVAGVAQGGRGNYDPTAYLKALWRKWGNARSDDYVWDVHVYSTTAANVVTGITALAKEMRLTGCRGCHLLLGEFGWSSSRKSSGCFRCVGDEAAQAKIASDLLTTARRQASGNLLDGAYWYRWEDHLEGSSPQRMGAVRPDATAKPLLAILTKFARLP